MVSTSLAALINDTMETQIVLKQQWGNGKHSWSCGQLSKVSGSPTKKIVRDYPYCDIIRTIAVLS
jgi:hypothetical protein